MFFIKKKSFLSKKNVFFFILMKYINIGGYGNDFKLFDNADLTFIKFIITIGCLYSVGWGQSCASLYWG